MTVSKALYAVPEQLKAQPLFLSIDDTVVEKKGEKFELCSKLFNHAAHNGSNYLNSHCMVGILLSFPVMTGSSMRWLLDKNQTKLETAAKIVRHAMGSIAQAGKYFCSAAAGI